MDLPKDSKIDDRSRYLRHLALDALEGGGRGHVGSTMSLIEILRVLYDDVLRYDPKNPTWSCRDRFILSKGHGCIALYVLLADKGFFDIDVLKSFCGFDSILGGHPERGAIPGVEVSTGSLGHGLAIGTGIAYAAKISEQAFRTYVVVGDGELNEGSIWESAMAASHHKLNNLTVVVDSNKLQSYGKVENICTLEPIRAKWESFGFNCLEVDGHDVLQLRSVFNSYQAVDKPTAVIAHTIKGRGIAPAEGNANWHHKSSFTSGDIKLMRESVDNA